MLRDFLMEYCENELEGSCVGNCKRHCNNKECCKGSCEEHKGCLDQVHWHPQYGGRRDYNCQLLLLKYVLKFTESYLSKIINALRLVDTDDYPQYNILTIGCGATPDLMAFEQINDSKDVHYRGIDVNPLWGEIHSKIDDYFDDECDDYEKYTVDLEEGDIFDILKDSEEDLSGYNIIVMQYVLSHFYNTGQNKLTTHLFEQIIQRVIEDRANNSPFLIIINDVDSMNKGRPYFWRFLDMLESNNLHGVAMAKSFHSTGDLGRERWSGHHGNSVFGNIRYKFIQNSSVQDGAQLIIELR